MQTIKSFKLLIIALVVCSNVFSQTNVYRSFPGTYGEWIVKKYGTFTSWQKFEAFGDTVIGMHTYKKVSRALNTGYPNGQGVIPFGPSNFYLAYRNDIVGKKVYMYSGSIDTLWYDFNLTVGDTLESTYSCYNEFANVRIVQSIDSVLICGSYYKRYNFNCNDYEADLVEGIGFLDNFLHTERDQECPFEPSYLYSTVFSTCNVTSVEDFLMDDQIGLAPNPTSFELKINSSSQMTDYIIVNNIGSIVLNGNVSDEQSINVSSLGVGLFIIKVQDKAGNYYQSKFIKQ